MWRRTAMAAWRRAVTRAVKESGSRSSASVLAGTCLERHLPADRLARLPSYSVSFLRAYAARMRRRVAPQRPPEYDEEEEEGDEGSEEPEGKPRTLRLVSNDNEEDDDDESEFSEEWEGIMLDFGGDGKDDDGKDADTKPRVGARMARRSLKR